MTKEKVYYTKSKTIEEKIKTKADCDYLINMLQSAIDNIKLIKEQTK